MANASDSPPVHTPPEPEPSSADAPIDLTPEYEDLPSTGVRSLRPVREVRAPRDALRFHWRAIIAGLFLGLGVEVLLGSLGLAIALSVIEPATGLSGLSIGTGVWMGLVALVALFVGGFAAARLGGAQRRGDGAIAGALTWATVLAVGLVAFGATPSTMYIQSTALTDTSARVVKIDDDPPPGRAMRAPPEVRMLAWAGFFGALVSLCAGVAGGALGAMAPRRAEDLPA